MIKSQAALELQRRKLFAKHPWLSELTVKTAADYATSDKVNSFNWLAGFIDKCWRHTYHARNGANKSRFIYTPNYLKWQLDAPWIDKNLTSVISDNEENILGLGYGVNKTLNLVGKKFKVAVHSGMSIHPEYTKKGIAQLIQLSSQAAAIKSGYDGCIYWWDAKNSDRGHAHNIFRKLEPSLKFSSGAFFATVFDYEKTIEVNRFNFPQKVFMKLTSGVPKPKGRDGFKTELITTGDNIDEITTLINAEAHIGNRSGHYVYTREELQRLLLYKSPTETKENPALKTTTTLLSNSQGVIQGLLYGYNIQVEEQATGNIFFIDNILTAPKIPARVKSDFIKNSLAIIAREQEVFGTLLVNNTCPIGLAAYRIFTPVLYRDLIPKQQNQIRGILSYNDTFDEALNSTARIYVDCK